MLFILNSKNFFYIFIVIIDANPNAFIIFILKFINITFKKSQQTSFIHIFKIFCLQMFDFIIYLNVNITSIIETIYKYRFYNININKIVFEQLNLIKI